MTSVTSLLTVRRTFWSDASCIRLAQAAPLVLVLTFAAILRLAGLGSAPLWSDETATAAFASLSWHDLLFGLGRLEPNPPAFYALEKIWTAIAGDSPLSLRVPSAIFGVATVTAIWSLTREVNGRPTAIIAALLCAVAPQHLDVSREARTYAVLLFLVTVTLLVARHLAASTTRQQLPALAAALAVLGGIVISLHYTGIVALFAVFAAAATAALRHPGHLAPRLTALAAAGIGALALGAPTLLGMLAIAADSSNNAAWIPAPSLELGTAFIVSVLAAPLAGLRLLPTTIGIAAFALGLLAICTVAAHAASRARTHADTAGLLAGLVAGVSAMAGLSQFRPIMVEHTLLFLLAFFFPLLAACLHTLARPGRILLLAILAAAAVPALSVIYAPARHGEDWPAVAAAAQAEVAATAWPIVTLGGFDALSLERVLPPQSSAHPILAITPLIGAALNDQVATSLTGAVPLPLTASPDELCAALGHPAGVIVLRHHAIAFEALQPHLAALLGAAGFKRETTLPATLAHNMLQLEHWTGPCASASQASPLNPTTTAPPAPTAPQ